MTEQARKEKKPRLNKLKTKKVISWLSEQPADGVIMKLAVYAITTQGCTLAERILQELGEQADLFLPERFVPIIPDALSVTFFPKGSFGPLLTKNWDNYTGHIFIMPTGVVIRKIAPLLKARDNDPAVLACDDGGTNIISLLGGHISGANQLTLQIAPFIGANPVITTGKKMLKIKAFDVLASTYGWVISNPGNIKIFNELLLGIKPVAVILPKNIFENEYFGKKNIFRIDHLTDLKSTDYAGVVLLDCELPVGFDIPVLHLVSTIK